MEAIDDYYDAVASQMEMDDFESQYADDMDALREMEEDHHEIQPPKSKRSLDFTSLPGNASPLEHSFEEADDKLSQNCIPMKQVKRDNNHLNDFSPEDDTISDSQFRKRLKMKDPLSSPVDCIENSEDINNEHDPQLLTLPLFNDPAVDGQKLNLNQRPRINWDLLSVRSSHGYRIFLRCKEDDSDINENFSFASRSSLLPVSISSLRQTLEEEYEKKLTHQSIDSPKIPPVQNDAMPSNIEQDDIINEERKTHSALWVDRYHPQSYMELLSDEGVNRTLLQWLKLWDKLAFGREPKKRPKKDSQKVLTQTKFNKPLFELTDELDEHGRPQFKIALLSGPPGLGKTTLAHVIASHAGYNVVEMNASDDRSPEFFSTQLEAATQMRAVLGKNPRPNCLVIDEIDGAPAPSINLLVSLVKSSGVAAKKRKKGEISLLLRPVICICNDQYTSAMKPLRQVALILNFPPTVSARLASRLLEISRKENLLADMAALLVLCEKAENDIRSCLSTLQFIRNQKNTVCLFDVQKIAVGQKDVQKTMFSVWQEIFRIPRPKRRRPGIRTDFEASVLNSGSDRPNDKALDNSSLPGRFRNILQSSQTCGDYEKQIHGMFENYLNINYKDPRLECLQNGVEWLCFSDIVSQEINSTQLYILMPYLPYTAVAFHLFFASLSYPKIAYPHKFFEFKNKTKLLESTFNSMMADVAISVRRFLNSTSCILDFFPCLQNIIKPLLRPVNIQLYSKWEKAELARVIDIMIACNLSYRQERSAEGHYQYLLEPNIEELVCFPGVKPQRKLTYAAKQLIAREVELEKMHRHEAKLPKPENNIKNTLQKPSENKRIANHKQTLQPKSIEEVKPALDFFGRKIEVVNEETNSESTVSSKSAKIWFRFKEGYSNAVRRPVRIADLL